MPKTPAYRKRLDRVQALVTLTDSATRRRKDYWLGEYGTPASRGMYHRVIAAWEANGRRLPRVEAPGASRDDDRRVKAIICEYWRWAKAYYDRNRAGAIKSALSLLRRYFGDTSALEFGPNRLRTLRDEMIRGDGDLARPRPPWSRKYINSQVQSIRHMFKWAAARELLAVSVHQSLGALEPLRRGRTTARENPKVGPVAAQLLDGTLPYLGRPVRAVVELQLLSGARPGELLSLKPLHIEMDEQSGVWTYRPETHKNAHREQERVIYFGPRSQGILRAFLRDRPTGAFCFSPAEAEATRRADLHERRVAPLSCGNRPGTNRKAAPKRQPAGCYTTASYRRAISYACDRGFPPAGSLARRNAETRAEWLERLKKDNLLGELSEWRRRHRWRPNQLRHNAATDLRREFGLEAAQLALGHASAQITDAVYAERDRAKVIEIMRRIG